MLVSVNETDSLGPARVEFGADATVLLQPVPAERLAQLAVDQLHALLHAIDRLGRTRCLNCSFEVVQDGKQVQNETLQREPAAYFTISGGSLPKVLKIGQGA
jgi:hypothetical protein